MDNKKYRDLDSFFKKYVERYVKDNPDLSLLQSLNIDIESLIYSFATHTETICHFRDMWKIEAILYQIEENDYDLSSLTNSELISLANETNTEIGLNDIIFERECDAIRDVCDNRNIPALPDF